MIESHNNYNYKLHSVSIIFHSISINEIYEK